MSNDNNGGSFALGLLIGGIIGGLIGVLLAPKAGSETRSEIWERSELLRSRADEAAASLRERVSPAASSAMSSVTSRIGRGQAEAEPVEPEAENTTQSNNGQDSQAESSSRA